MKSSTEQHHLGPVILSPGVLPQHGWTFLYAAFVSIGLVTFVSIGQAYILNEHLKIPIAEQGTISGNLVFWTEIVTLLFFIPAGVLMDRIGRKPIYIAGMILLAIAYGLYPMAQSVADLTLYRIVYALGIVAVTGGLATVMVDYPAERSRGKLIAITGFLNGLGIVILNQFFGGLPEKLIGRGFSGVEAGIIAHMSIAALALVTAIVLSVGLKGGTPVRKEERPPLKTLLTSGFTHAKNPRILLSYAAAFVARGDQSIIGTFLPLWGTTAGIAMGMNPAEAVKKGMMVFIISQAAALLWAPVIGPLIDRWNRVTALVVCMGLASAGYLSLALIENPHDSFSTLYFVLLGIGQISAFLGSQSLIGQEAPREARGSVIGMFNISGAIGILIITTLGGRMFDQLSPKAPFLVVGAINLLVMLGGIYVRIKAPGTVSVRASASASEK
ncbi:MFS transporter [Chlorobium phaeovibrioides]|uniref:MFS transporter n=1 Tax=Chlorobium phaeovibrioides TaxID=1094 RepID=A0ABW9UTP8_CHLPH|nr:MFS transporter [Chlorobium phaeovibrioides]MWV54821.1 MFS transporter [Chlorobium phaeovibrioides]